MDPYSDMEWLEHAHAAAAALAPHGVPSAPRAYHHDAYASAHAAHSPPMTVPAVRRWLATQHRLAQEGQLDAQEQQILTALGLHWAVSPRVAPLCEAHFDALLQALRRELQDIAPAPVPTPPGEAAPQGIRGRRSLLQRRQHVQGQAGGSAARDMPGNKALAATGGAAPAARSAHAPGAGAGELADDSTRMLGMHGADGVEWLEELDGAACVGGSALQDALAIIVQATVPRSLAYAAVPVAPIRVRSVLADWLHQCAALQHLGWLPRGQAERLASLAGEWQHLSPGGGLHWERLPEKLASEMPAQFADRIAQGLAVQHQDVGQQTRRNRIRELQRHMRWLLRNTDAVLRPSHAAQMLAATGLRSVAWFAAHVD